MKFKSLLTVRRQVDPFTTTGIPKWYDTHLTVFSENEMWSLWSVFRVVPGTQQRKLRERVLEKEWRRGKSSIRSRPGESPWTSHLTPRASHTLIPLAYEIQCLKAFTIIIISATPVSWGILVPWLGFKPAAPALDEWNLKHCTNREEGSL